MTRAIVLAFLLFTASVAVSAQGFYFDIGFGYGKGWTEIGGTDFVDYLNDAGINSSEVYEVAVDVGFKAGYGPLGNMPLYIVGEIGGMGHRIYDSFNYIQFNSYIIGPSVIFYPIPLIQLGLSVGYSYVANQTDMPIIMSGSKSGVAYNISAAIDLGKGNHGCLIGVKYFNANNTLAVSNVNEKAAMVGIFIRYTYRKKVLSL
jgi:hypothetical protein